MLFRILVPLIVPAATSCAHRSIPAEAPAVTGIAVGDIHRYVRSDRDGAQAEWISVYRKSATTLEVYKMRAKCINAALVTAQLDPERGQASQLLGGRLRANARREVFATLDYDPDRHRIDAVVELPERTQRDSLVLHGEPWHLYDFDLASLAAMPPPQVSQRKDFAIELALVMPDDATGRFLTRIGQAQARFVREERREGRPALRFEVGGEAFGANGGPLWLARDGGYVIEASWGLPNHAEHKDFRLRLLGIEHGGQAAWERVLRSHFEGCPPDG